MLRQALAGLAISTVAFSFAHAQGTSTPTASQTAVPAGNFLQQQSNVEFRGSNIIGAKVIGGGDQKIGEVNDIIVDQNGNVQAVIVGVGGFLGIGEKNVAIPFKNMTVTRSSNEKSIDHITVTYTKDQLNSAPSYKYFAANS